MVLMLKFSMRNVALILGFYSVFLLPASLSKLISGGTTFSSGLILSLVIFFVLASPFGIRYYISSRIILTNFLLASLILILYFISSIIFLEVDNMRFLLSLVLIFLMSFAAVPFITTLDLLKDELFHKIIIFAYYFLLFIGFIASLRMFIYGNADKDMIIYSEPSYYAIIFIPLLFYAAYTSNKKLYAFLHVLSAIVIAIVVQNLTLLVGCLMITFVLYGTRLSSLFFIFIFLTFMAFFLNLDYFLVRISIFSGSHNPSLLAYLSGWERAYLSFTSSYGFGLGFQQLGIVGPQGDIQVLLQDVVGTNVVLLKGGGSLGSKVIAEMGLLGLIFVLFYIYFAIKILLKIMLRQIKGSKNIFFLGIYLFFSIEFFVRGMGYFSLLSFMFISSLYWIYRSRVLQPHSSLI